MFDFYYLTHHKSFADLVDSHPKGYVSFRHIFQQANLQTLFDLYSINIEKDYEQISHILRQYIKKNSKKLWSNPIGIRRLGPIKSKGGKFRPVYIESFDDRNKC
jgi:hypothetical protein